MPRDLSGNMTLPAGNPVVTGTAISSAVHNATVADLAAEIQDSLSRSGKGGMTAPFQHADGTEAAPAATFASETGSGLYRTGAGSIGMSILGAWKTIWNAGAFVVRGALNLWDASGGGTGKQISITAPAALAADYLLALPAALPASTLPITCTSAGQLATGQITNAQQNFGTPSVATDVAIKSYVDGTADTPTPGTNVNISALYVVRRGTLVTVHGSVTFGATTFGSGVTFLTLSTGFRPLGGLEFLTNMYDSSTGNQTMARVGITPGGLVSVVQAWTLVGWTGADPLPCATGDVLSLNITFNV